MSHKIAVVEDNQPPTLGAGRLPQRAPSAATMP